MNIIFKITIFDLFPIYESLHLLTMFRSADDMMTEEQDRSGELLEYFNTEGRELLEYFNTEGSHVAK